MHHSFIVCCCPAANVHEAAVKFAPGEIDPLEERGKSAAAAGQRRLLHELSRSEQSDSPTRRDVVPGDLNADFENVSEALGVSAGGSAGLTTSSHGGSEPARPQSPGVDPSTSSARYLSRQKQIARCLYGH